MTRWPGRDPATVCTTTPPPSRVTASRAALVDRRRKLITRRVDPNDTSPVNWIDGRERPGRLPWDDQGPDERRAGRIVPPGGLGSAGRSRSWGCHGQQGQALWLSRFNDDGPASPFVHLALHIPPIPVAEVRCDRS
jgi:hypothetical protein